MSPSPAPRPGAWAKAGNPSSSSITAPAPGSKMRWRRTVMSRVRLAPAIGPLTPRAWVDLLRASASVAGTAGAWPSCAHRLHRRQLCRSRSEEVRGTSGKDAKTFGRSGRQLTDRRCRTDFVASEQIPVLSDLEDAFKQRYGSRPGMAWLIRPDGHIGALRSSGSRAAPALP